MAVSLNSGGTRGGAGGRMRPRPGDARKAAHIKKVAEELAAKAKAKKL